MQEAIDLPSVVYYLFGFLFTSMIALICKMIYDAWTDKRKEKNIHIKLDEINEDNKSIKHYIRDKGVDDFINECKYWNKQGHIPPEIHSRLLIRYEDLEHLDANGERKTGKKILDNLQIKE